MTLSEVVDRLHGEGLPITLSKLQYACISGKLGDVPLDGACNRNFAESHVGKMREYLKSCPRRGKVSRADREGKATA